jgi:PAS domain S-box-containing protein
MWSTCRAIVVALLATVLMALFRHFVFIPLFDFSPPIMPSLLAVMLAASVGGFRSGLFATVVNAGLLTLVYGGEIGIQLFSMPNVFRFIMFVAIGGVISWGIDTLHAARQRAEVRQRELETEIRRREQVEAALRDQEERVRLAVEAANIGTWDFNPVTGEQEWSSRAKIMFGLSPDADLSNVSFRDRVHPEDREQVNQAIQRAFDPNGDGGYEIDCRLVWPDNTVHWFIAKGQATFEGEKPSRRATRFVGTVIDITERKQAEQLLREAEDKFRRLATQAPVGIFQTDSQGRCVFVNDLWSSIAGVSAEHALGDGWARFVHPEDRQKIVEEWQEATRHGRNLIKEFRFLNQETGVRWVIVSATTMLDIAGSVSGYVGTIVDVTERKAIEEVVRASESRLKAMMDNTSAVIYLKDAEGRYLMINRRFEELFNITQQQIAGKTDADIFPDDVVAQLQINDRQVRGTGQALEFEEVVPHSDGPHTYVSVKFPITDANGTVLAIGGISTDITDRKAVEDVIRDSETRLRGILNNTPAVISLKDLYGRYVLVNRGWEELFGVTNEEIVGLTNEELLSATLSPHMSRRIADQFLTIDRHVIQAGEAIEFEDPMPLGDDQRVFATIKFPIKDAHSKVTGIGGISIDITERRRASDLLAAEQAMLRHTVEFQDQERELVSYEIHDGLVQYATGALMQLEGIRHQLESEADAAQIERVVQVLRTAVAEGRRLVNGIRTPVIDDWGVVAAIEQLIGEPEQSNLQIQFIKGQALGRLAPRLEETLYRITQEAITNIRKHSQSKRVQIELARRGDRIRLEIRDWGIGFVPSNKSVGTHGLSGIRNRTRIAGGQCTIKSAPGEGTTIEVDLPYLSRA